MGWPELLRRLADTPTVLELRVLHLSPELSLAMVVLRESMGRAEVDWPPSRPARPTGCLERLKEACVIKLQPRN
ncbi:hypothetical protein RRG08_048550 [Elysia crispata]|uniref:Uncharacterized protein n=1 Tax=Elysia crispata TaxID=231223 RepID=A0AAE1B6Y3_9GAST|nr:hypothetical protein RRG08_048550 [Elysia crispata]